MLSTKDFAFQQYTSTSMSNTPLVDVHDVVRHAVLYDTSGDECALITGLYKC